MYYRESSPSAQLSGVKCFWSLEYTGSLEPEAIIPDGCIEIVFNLADRFRRYDPVGASLQPFSLVAGQMRRSVLIGPSGDVRLFGIRFFPLGAQRFFRMDLSELTDRIEALDTVWKGTDEIVDQLAAAEDHEQRVHIAEVALRSRIVPTREDRRTQAAVDMIRSSRGAVAIARLAEHLELSERRLERRFATAIGLSPKSFARIIRFQSLLRSIEQNSDLSDLAFQYGYYDQSHMTADFRQFANTTPKAFLEKQHALTDVFIDA